jgi:hypothetical protein
MDRPHPLAPRVANGPGFIEAAPALIDEFPGLLRLRPGVLDGSVDGLDRLDGAARSMGGQARLDDPNILAPLVLPRSSRARPRHTPRRRGRPPRDHVVYACDDPR